MIPETPAPRVTVKLTFVFAETGTFCAALTDTVPPIPEIEGVTATVPVNAPRGFTATT